MGHRQCQKMKKRFIRKNNKWRKEEGENKEKGEGEREREKEGG